MSALRVVRGDATCPQAKGPKIVAHVCNDIGGWGKGFVLALSRRWPEPERDYRRWHRERADNDFGLGAVRLVRVQPDVHVANMIGQRGIRTGSAGPPIRYDAVRRCLEALAGHAAEHGASVHIRGSAADWRAGSGSGSSRSSSRSCAPAASRSPCMSRGEACGGQGG
ncbi:hypothetical protein SAMN05421806_10553 [Streptomyces indicus]|uniref:Macro domain-containing protein n=1 Tax=Streptomyces indicus TaxID=417292 RepID=A0A1G8ZM74_9ACTN|nr:hypothetical protein SAMN05421806_10553 [Streptomyces indicus]